MNQKIEKLIEKYDNKIKERDWPIYSMVSEWLEDLKSLQEPIEVREVDIKIRNKIMDDLINNYIVWWNILEVRKLIEYFDDFKEKFNTFNWKLFREIIDKNLKSN